LTAPPDHPSTNESNALPAWVGSLRGQIWIAPDIEAAQAEIAREMEGAPPLREAASRPTSRGGS
jgi:hypothetical protein